MASDVSAENLPLSPEPKRRSLNISTVTQRSIRFVVGLSALVYEFLSREEPRWQWLLAWATFAGSPIANWADDMRREMTDRVAGRIGGRKENDIDG